MRRRARIRIALAGVSVLAGATVLVGCGVPLDSEVRVVPAEQVPHGLLDEQSVPNAPSGAEGVDTEICLSAKGQLLSVPRADTDSSLAEILRIGPTEGEAAIGLRNVVDEDLLSDVTLDGDVALVELTEQFADLAGDQQLLAVAQLTCTATAQPGVAAVSFSLDGERVDVPIQGGALSERPVTRGDYERLLIN